MLLVIQAVVSFRSVPRILSLFNVLTDARLSWIPHFTSVINWSLRLGLGLLKQVKPISEPWVAIIDHSIDIGTKKALVVLRVPIAALSLRGSAIQLADCECIGLKISVQVNGESIARDLDGIFNSAGTPKAIIKDGDYTLQKGVRLWSEQQPVDVPVIADIGHALATALKKHDAYKQFTALTTQAANRLRQTELAFLIPPKLRSKGRFQSIGSLGKWADKMLDVLAVPGRAKKGSLLAKLPEHYRAFSGSNLSLKALRAPPVSSHKYWKYLKTKGLINSITNNVGGFRQHCPKIPRSNSNYSSGCSNTY